MAAFIWLLFGLFAPIYELLFIIIAACVSVAVYLVASVFFPGRTVEVDAKPDSGDEAVNDFSRIMNETGARDHFIVRSAGYFRSLLSCLGDNARLYMAYHDGRPIAGTIAIRFAGKVWYLYGASSNADRNLMPNYLLQWEMIRWALDSGCFLYDFRGVSGDLSPDNPLYGLYRFKKGFTGEFTEFLGEYDYVLKPWVVSAVKNGRRLLSTAHKVKRAVSGIGAPKKKDGGAQ